MKLGGVLSTRVLFAMTGFAVGLTAAQVAAIVCWGNWLGLPLWVEVPLFPGVFAAFAAYDIGATLGVSVIAGCAATAVFYAFVFDFAYVVARNAARRRQKRHGGAGGAGSLEYGCGYREESWAEGERGKLQRLGNR